MQNQPFNGMPQQPVQYAPVQDPDQPMMPPPQMTYTAPMQPVYDPTAPMQPVYDPTAPMQPVYPQEPMQQPMYQDPMMMPPPSQTAPMQPLVAPITYGSPNSAPETLQDKLRDLNFLFPLIACVLSVAYALFATISFGHVGALLPHFLVVWVTSLVSGAAGYLRQPILNLVAVVGYVLSMLLFLNYAYLLLPSLALCGYLVYKTFKASAR